MDMKDIYENYSAKTPVNNEVTIIATSSGVFLAGPGTSNPQMFGLTHQVASQIGKALADFAEISKALKNGENGEAEPGDESRPLAIEFPIDQREAMLQKLLAPRIGPSAPDMSRIFRSKN